VTGYGEYERFTYYGTAALTGGSFFLKKNKHPPAKPGVFP
jgi:hypothetical protein